VGISFAAPPKNLIITLENRAYLANLKEKLAEISGAYWMLGVAVD